MSTDEHAKNNLPDVAARWLERDGSELQRARTEQSFCVSKTEIADEGYNLSVNRYKETVHAEAEYRLPKEVITELNELEAAIQQGLRELEAMLG